MDTCRVHIARVCDPSLWPPFCGGNVELIVPRRSYDAYLGMRRASQLKKQLDIDIPRSDVRAPNGERIYTSDAVLAVTPHARFCTQAVCAPILEWFMRSELFARELPSGYHPLVVSILSCGSIAVRKRLLVGMALVDIGVFVTRDTVVLSSNPVDGSTTTSMRRHRVRPFLYRNRRMSPWRRCRRDDHVPLHDDGARGETPFARAVPDKDDGGGNDE